MKAIGITTTVPVEVLFAAGYKVIDLNNIFIGSVNYSKYIEEAERDGFPKSSCAWIKGIYGACIYNNISEIVGVVEGDCSNTRALAEVLKSKGIKVCPFSYPESHKLKDITESIKRFMSIFGVSIKDTEKVRTSLSNARKLAKKIDKLTYDDNKATGFENHLYQIMLSDFNGDRYGLEKQLEQKVLEIEKRSAITTEIRLGYIGVPPMTLDIYDYVENAHARVVYNEVQREFAFPRHDKARDIFEQYSDYTYPYDLSFRLSEIKKQIRGRKIDALINYTQAFCHRGIEEIVIKKELKIPMLTIEADKLNALDQRMKIRLEAFLDMIYDQKKEANR